MSAARFGGAASISHWLRFFLITHSHSLSNFIVNIYSSKNSIKFTITFSHAEIYIVFLLIIPFIFDLFALIFQLVTNRKVYAH